MAQSYTDQLTTDCNMRIDEYLQELPAYVSAYINSLTTSKQPRTRLEYTKDIFQFFTYLSHTTGTEYPIDITFDQLEKLNSDDINQYTSYLSSYDASRGGTVKVWGKKDRVNNKASLKRKIAALRGLFMHLCLNGFRFADGTQRKLQSNPMLAVRTPKVDEKNIIRLDDDEVNELISVVRHPKLTNKKSEQLFEKTKERDFAIIMVLLGTGIRLSELISMDLEHINFKTKEIKVLLKGGREGLSYFDNEVEEALLSYLEVRDLFKPAPGYEHALFLSLQHKRLTAKAVENLLLKYAGMINTNKHITCHVLRKTYGCRAYEATHDLMATASALHHKSPTVTKKHYVTEDEKQQRSIASLPIKR